MDYRFDGLYQEKKVTESMVNDHNRSVAQVEWGNNLQYYSLWSSNSANTK